MGINLLTNSAVHNTHQVLNQLCPSSEVPRSNGSELTPRGNILLSNSKKLLYPKLIINDANHITGVHIPSTKFQIHIESLLKKIPLEVVNSILEDSPCSVL